MSMLQYQQKHKDQPILVLGTGPSAWDLGRRSEFVEVLRGITTIAINRGIGVGLPVHYQISLDRIWSALLKKPQAKKSYQRLQAAFNAWRSKHGQQVCRWTVEEFAQAHWKLLDLHPEVQTYLKLCSPHAPFVRFMQSPNSKSCPYRHVSFKPVQQVNINRYVGLLNRGNSAHPAINLAGLMGGNPIFILGIDMAHPDPKARPWERCVYAREGVLKGFRILREKMRGVVVYNLNSDAKLDAFTRVKSYGEALDILRRYQSLWKH